MSILSDLFLLKRASTATFSVKNTSPRTILILRLVICLAFAALVGFNLYASYSVDNPFPYKEALALSLFVLLGIANALNIKSVHPWYLIVNRLWFILEIGFYLFYAVFVLISFIFAVITLQWGKAAQQGFGLGLLGFQTYFGYQFYKIIQDQASPYAHIPHNPAYNLKQKPEPPAGPIIRN